VHGAITSGLGQFMALVRLVNVLLYLNKIELQFILITIGLLIYCNYLIPASNDKNNDILDMTEIISKIFYIFIITYYNY